MIQTRQGSRNRQASVVAVDLGGTNTRVAIVEPDGSVSRRVEESTAGEDRHPDELISIVKRVAGGGAATEAVVGVPGRIDHARGRLELAPNLPSHWAERLTEERLSFELGLAVSIANDADLAAVGEYRFGAGRGTSDMVYLTISTGIGCGVIVGGTLLHGRRSLGEAGHTIVDCRAPAGRRSLEDNASGSALSRLARERGLKARGAELVELVRAGEPDAMEVWDRVVAAAGAGIVGVAHMFSPELIVLGGGLGLVGELLYAPLREALAASGPRAMPQPIRIEGAQLGDDAGLAGAAGWFSTFTPVPEP